MQILILGADTFIGEQVALALAASAWGRPIAATARGGPVGMARRVFDPADPASVAAALRDIDGVVNALQGAPPSIEAGAQALFGAASQRDRPPLIVQVSSMSVYGSACGEVREDAPLLADLGAYSQAQARAEALAARYARGVILRPGCEYGPGGEVWSRRVAQWLGAHRLGDLGAAGDGCCNLVYIDDVVAAVLRVLQDERTVGKAFNLAMPDPPTWNQYFVRFGRALGAVPVRRISRRRLAIETRLLAAPLRVAEIAARAAGFPHRVPPAIPPSLLRLCSQEIRLLADRARQELQWTCTPLDTGLARTAAWYRQSRERARG